MGVGLYLILDLPRGRLGLRRTVSEDPDLGVRRIAYRSSLSASNGFLRIIRTGRLLPYNRQLSTLNHQFVKTH